MNTQFVAFIVELFKRFGNKSPKFFNILTTVGIIATIVINTLPPVLASIGSPLSPFWQHLTGSAMTGALLAASIVSQLTVANVGTANLPMTQTPPPAQPYTAPQDSTATK